jgi:hypothetical protein
VGRLTGADVACWVLKTSRPPGELVPDWRPGPAAELTRCVRRSHRLELMTAGQPCLLWLSGRDRPGIHALGRLTGPPESHDDDGPVVPLRLVLLEQPVPRAELLADPRTRDAEVLRMPAGSNPSWLTAGQFAAVLARVDRPALGPWHP